MLAECLISSDVRFATEAQTAAEKLYGWSCVVDVCHGVNHDIANAIRNSVFDVGPALSRVAAMHAENPAVGMDLVNRVLFEFQQDCFAHLNELAAGGAPAAPTFAQIKNKVLTCHAPTA